MAVATVLAFIKSSSTTKAVVGIMIVGWSLTGVTTTTTWVETMCERSLTVMVRVVRPLAWLMLDTRTPEADVVTEITPMVDSITLKARVSPSTSIAVATVLAFIKSSTTTKVEVGIMIVGGLLRGVTTTTTWAEVVRELSRTLMVRVVRPLVLLMLDTRTPEADVVTEITPVVDSITLKARVSPSTSIAVATVLAFIKPSTTTKVEVGIMMVGGSLTGVTVTTT